VIRRIQIDNFKSLSGFSLPAVGTPPLGRFTCLIGANGSGKTSVLQALDFLSHLTSQDINEWFNGRDWSPTELRPSFVGTRPSSLEFEVDLDLQDVGDVRWTGKFSFPYLMHEAESVRVGGEKVLDFRGGRLMVLGGDAKSAETDLGLLKFNYSILALFDEKIGLVSLAKLRSAMNGIKSLELLSPSSMRRSSRPSESMGWSGEKLAGFFGQLKPEIRILIQERVREFFPSLAQLRVQSKPGGYRTLSAKEREISSVNARHLSDGFLRILAVVSQVEQTNTPDTVILLDEIENGLHPELIERLVKYLLQAKVQVIVTTHSPMILNYLSDDEAKDAMILLYRSREGKTRSCRYFDLPSAKKKLGILGPGEVFVDTPVEQLAREAEEMDRSREIATVNQ